jgi:hypothetical protein
MPIQNKKRARMTFGQITILLILSFILVLLTGIIGILYLGVDVLSFIRPSAKTSLPTITSLNVFIDLSIDLKTNVGRPIITGQTNLPNGTIIMITVRGESNSFVGQDKVYVTNGTFKSTQFTLPESPFDIDKYSVEALMPYANVQPESVRRVIGNTGEWLRGKYVMRDSSGTLVQAMTNFEIYPQLINLIGSDIGKRKVDSPNTDFSYAITLVKAYITNKIYDLISIRVGYNDFVVAEIVYENLGIYPTDLKAEDFMLNIQDGIEGNTSPYSRGIDGMSFYMPVGVQNTDYLETATVNPGESFHGLIVFENPRNTRTYVLTLKIPCATDCDNVINSGSAFKFSK